MKKRNIYALSGFLFLLICLVVVFYILDNREANSEHIAEQPDLTLIEDEFYNGLTKTKVQMDRDPSDNLYFENQTIHNGELLMLFEDDQGVVLEEGNHVLVDLNIHPDGHSSLAFGYVVDGKYTEIFAEAITDRLITDFTVQEEGEYVFYIGGFMAGPLNINNGTIDIDR